MFLLMLLCTSSCQKESGIALAEQQVSHSQASVRSSVDLDQQVIQHTQWLINHMIPLVADGAVSAAIEAGNINSPVVTARLQELGFANFEQFALAFNSSGSAVQAAINAGTLKQSQISQIVQGHTFDYSPIGGPGGLPCTQQLAIDLAWVPVYVALAAGSGPWSAVIAGAVQVAVAYVNFKNCLRATYPEAP